MQSTQIQQQQLLSTEQAAARLGLGISTLEKDRVSGKLGIPYLKLGRRVLYDPQALDIFLKENQRHNTSEGSR